jgi:hypothetical protein
MSKIIQFGKVIPGLEIDGKPAPYPVLNERDARAAAGIMLILGILAFVQAFIYRRFEWINVFVILFFLEFLIRIAVNPSFAPFYAWGSLFVSNQRPEWVGAAQKRFAWLLGALMAVAMIVLIYVFNVRGPVNAIICMICLTLMWLETSLGICVGCKIYAGLIKLGLIKKPDVMPACPGGVCSIDKHKKKH